MVSHKRGANRRDLEERKMAENLVIFAAVVLVSMSMSNSAIFVSTVESVGFSTFFLFFFFSHSNYP
jgi:hypothetical protein